VQVDVKEIEFNPEFINRMLSRLEWPVLVQTANQLGVGEGLPEMLPEDQIFEDEEVLKKV
jgi:multifunctional methyltransferase subunit TRM112